MLNTCTMEIQLESFPKLRIQLVESLLRGDIFPLHQCSKGGVHRKAFAQTARWCYGGGASSAHVQAVRKEIGPPMALQMSAATRLSQGLRVFFSEFVRVSVRHPSQA